MIEDKDFIPKKGELIQIYPPRLSAFFSIKYICIFKEIKDNIIYTYAAVSTSDFAECADGNERLFINEQFDLIKNRVYKPSKYSAKQMLDIMKEHHKIWDKATKAVIDDPQWLEETKNKEDKEKAMLEKCNKQFIY